MDTVNQQLKNSAAYGFETALQYAQTALDAAEQAIKLNLEFSRQSLLAKASATQALANESDPEKVIEQINGLVSQSLARVVSGSNATLEIITQAQEQFSKLNQQLIETLSQGLLGRVDGFASQAPLGADWAINFFRYGEVAAVAALDGLSQVTPSVAESDGAENGVSEPQPVASKPAISKPASRKPRASRPAA